MKKSLAFISAAALAVLAGCNKEAAAPETAGEGQKIQLTLNATRGEDTKTSIEKNDNYGSLESKWAVGDKIHVYSTKSNSELGTLDIVGSSIINEGGGTTGQYATSKATFSGSVTLGANDDISSDTFVFMYLGSGVDSKSITVTDGAATISYDIAPITSVSGMAAYDIARATGKILGTASEATCAVTFSNLISFGYFTTKPITQTLTGTYKTSFTVNINNGNVEGVEGQITLPSNADFYLPLVKGDVNIKCNRVWAQNGTTYTQVAQSKSFNVTAGGQYWRMGALQNYGPVAFTESDDITYDVLANVKFAVGDASYVRFTPGNLQYIGSAAEPYWRLAETQFDYLGTANAKPASSTTESILYTGDIDLFGWGEVGAAYSDADYYRNIPNDGKLYFQGSTDNAKYLGNADWLGHLAVGANGELPDERNWATKFNGENPTKLYADKVNDKTYPLTGSALTYKVLSSTEWTELFRRQKFFFCCVTTLSGAEVNGIAVLPYNVTSIEGVSNLYQLASNETSLSGLSDEYNKNKIKQNVIDSNHLLFLPASGRRHGSGISKLDNCILWSTVWKDYALGVIANPTRVSARYTIEVQDGAAVRLVSVVSEVDPQNP